MKSKILILISLFFIASCSKNDKSDAYGYFSTDEIILSAETNGKIVKLNFDQGDKLHQGDTIAVVDTTLLHLQKQQLIAKKKAISSKFEEVIAQVQVLNKQKQVLETQRKRLENLLKDSAVSQQKYDNIVGQIDVIDQQIKKVKANNSSIFAELDATEAGIKLIDEQIARCFITSPIEGILLEKYINIHELATVGKPLFKIANTEKMTLTVYVSEDQLSSIKIGQKANVFIDNPEKKPLQGKVVWISEQAEFTPKIIQTKKERVNLVYAVKINVPNDGTLKIGMPADVVFVN